MKMFLILFSVIQYTTAVSQSTVRLYRNGIPDTSQSWSSGIVQIYYNDQWGNICGDSSFGSDEADVICHQLGYTGASSYSNTGTNTVWGVDSSPGVLDSVDCSKSTYLTITQCSFTEGSCGFYGDVIVTCDPTRIWHSPSTGDIRLTEGTYSNQGLLEVYCNGQWGTVCGDNFGPVEARIACRQLGYNIHTNYGHLWQRGSTYQNIWLQDLSSSCSPTGRCLTSCGSCPTSPIIGCSHYEDMTLECGYDSVYTGFGTGTTSTDCRDPTTAPTGTVRLYRNGIADTSQSWSSGIVQIYYSNQWGNICDDYFFESNEADVICHQLGYTGASSYSNTGTNTVYGTDESITSMSNVYCYNSSSYLSITQCLFSTTSINSDCTDYNDVIVTCYPTRIWHSPSTGDIRLTGGTYSNQGLLEVYCNGQWGTVCGDTLSYAAARIACKQLGYNYYQNYGYPSIHGNYSQNIWLKLDSFTSCSYTSDVCLTSCGFCPVGGAGITTCSHTQDMTLSCKYSTSYSKVLTTVTDECRSIGTGSATQGAVRLYRNGVPDITQSWSSGIVQIYYNGQWGNICDDSHFRSDEADVICHQLGYTGASSYSNTGTNTVYGIDESITSLFNVYCSTSSYLTITQCSFNATIINSGCANNNDVIVTCYSTRIWDSPSTGDIRLTGGTYSNQGLLEVYCNGQWGTVCDDDFFITQARVACRQLGYNAYSDYNHLKALRGTSSLEISMYNLLDCHSSSSCFINCGGCSRIANDLCTHSEDVTLTCEYDDFDYSKVNTVITDSCSVSNFPRSAIIGISIGSVIAFIVCVVAAITIPLCVCVCIRMKGRSPGTRLGKPIRTRVLAPPAKSGREDEAVPFINNPSDEEGITGSTDNEYNMTALTEQNQSPYAPSSNDPLQQPHPHGSAPAVVSNYPQPTPAPNQFVPFGQPTLDHRSIGQQQAYTIPY